MRKGFALRGSGNSPSWERDQGELAQPTDLRSVILWVQIPPLPPKFMDDEEISKIRDELEELEEFRLKCKDTGVLKAINAWIEENKKKIVSECKHHWEEQPGEPPQDICIFCGAVRE